MRQIRQISIFLMIAAMCGCAAFRTVVWSPESEKLYAIEDAAMDCKVASVYGQQFLRADGYYSRVVCGYYHGGGQTVASMGHCWLEVLCEADGEWHMVDLTRYGDEGWPVAQYTDYVPTDYWYGCPSVYDLTFNVGPDWSAKDRAAIVEALPVRFTSPSDGVILRVK
jgi:hypothetical protein